MWISDWSPKKNFLFICDDIQAALLYSCLQIFEPWHNEHSKMDVNIFAKLLKYRRKVQLHFLGVDLIQVILT